MQNNFRIGPTLGFGTAFMHNKNRTNRNAHAHIGLIGNYEINKILNLQPSLFLSAKGYGGGSNGGGFGYDSKEVSLGYIDAIITLKFQPWKIIFIGFGPQVGYLASASYSYQKEAYDPEHKKVKINHITNDWDYGLNGSIGCQFKSGVGIEFAVVYGLRDVFNQHSNEIVDVNYNNNPLGHPIYIPEEAKGRNAVFTVSFYALLRKKINNQHYQFYRINK